MKAAGSKVINVVADLNLSQSFYAGAELALIVKVKPDTTFQGKIRYLSFPQQGCLSQKF